jgi:hypothetical protein
MGRQSGTPKEDGADAEKSRSVTPRDKKDKGSHGQKHMADMELEKGKRKQLSEFILNNELDQVVIHNLLGTLGSTQ